jgi:hypothetical protein
MFANVDISLDPSFKLYNCWKLMIIGRQASGSILFSCPVTQSDYIRLLNLHLDGARSLWLS